MVKPLVEFRHLSLSERLQLVEDIRDSIAEHPDTVPLTAEQRAEIDRRLADHRRDPSSAIPWEQVRAELFGADERDERGG